MAKQFVVTEAGYQKMKEELDFLKNVKRKEAAEAVGVARSFGDLSENSEYDDAKNEQGKIELQIQELEDMLTHAKIINDNEIHTDAVGVGVTVELHDIDFDEDLEYTIVSPIEVNIGEGKISDQSPIGKALVGAKVGDLVSVEIPDGTIRFKVLGIKKD